MSENIRLWESALWREHRSNTLIHSRTISLAGGWNVTLPGRGHCPRYKTLAHVISPQFFSLLLQEHTTTYPSPTRLFFSLLDELVSEILFFSPQTGQDKEDILVFVHLFLTRLWVKSCVLLFHLLALAKTRHVSFYTGSESEFVAFTILWLSSVEIGWFSQKRPFFELILR